MTRLEKIEVWRAFFNDYRDLSKGLLLKVGSEPYIYSNMASDFEVINKLHLDLANEKIEQLQSENTHLKEQIDAVIEEFSYIESWIRVDTLPKHHPIKKMKEVINQLT